MPKGVKTFSDADFALLKNKVMQHKPKMVGGIIDIPETYSSFCDSIGLTEEIATRLKLKLRKERSYLMLKMARCPLGSKEESFAGICSKKATANEFFNEFLLMNMREELTEEGSPLVSVEDATLYIWNDLRFKKVYDYTYQQFEEMLESKGSYSASIQFVDGRGQGVGGGRSRNEDMDFWG